jgi:hypothetical protein
MLGSRGSSSTSLVRGAMGGGVGSTTKCPPELPPTTRSPGSIPWQSPRKSRLRRGIRRVRTPEHGLNRRRYPGGPILHLSSSEWLIWLTELGSPPPSAPAVGGIALPGTTC